ncbi:nucleotidyltransferase [Aliikangiella coralliicola]|uniref:Nucleotidyltransferase n=1 Tax=Aliikangiella coralliicola TaxID=2592383 RepID=A0A545TV20_9GAMM|nr:nucleotidyltransferase [Aliikangiella coralliicola]TQV81068.1 nucleotidyltransferase [Aliikangiella coralliicola]
MRKKRNDIRRLLVREAARLMYEEGVDQYLDAKRKAAKRILGKQTRDLPSNGEIAEELFQLSQFHQGDELEATLFEMRILAMDVMENLAEFSPRLIGSVSTGKVRQGSDIDLHVFTNSLENLQAHLEAAKWSYSLKKIWIQKSGRPAEFTHIYLDFDYPVELSIYPENEIRVRGRSSTDGKPIERLSASKLRDLVMNEHSEAWKEYIS